MSCGTRAQQDRHCRRCCSSMITTRSFRGINNIKNGTFPSLSIVSSIVYTTLMDLVNPGFEIFLAENLPFIPKVVEALRARPVPEIPSDESTKMAEFRGVWSLRLDICSRGRRAPGHLSTGYPQRHLVAGVWSL